MNPKDRFLKINAYIYFLKAISQAATQDEYIDLDAIESDLLNYIMIEDYEGRSLLVGDLLNLRLLGSQATLHGRLKKLEKYNLIKLVGMADARKRQVSPTHSAYDRFNFLNDFLVIAAKI